ncbi:MULTISPECIES: carboxymuconolactone decarboxylase family protein [unclassified Beijerinckia]|uniref:carboxymuconolactone decarboxylase family protein n=1 Tax=unclassified Beijerinckia TaxID=2638183 RepID=UPI00089A2B1E|nr:MULTISPECIES: carboxymuconolactone decarboxylase family protein [unclassified Beijerinckia]MDH7799320.1 AhpD family alkylhydroperoxidase [Beijerinckia sp. GAS462]SED46121.1 alkylhydroperoxidase AhpD family core domain-containing protein [Beijerinckia sp. 28-YEA-48]
MPRLNYGALSPDQLKKYLEFSQAAAKGAIEPKLVHLVELRASQVNGCAFCVDMHVKQLKIAGESELRLHHVVIWRESPLFSARERAALEWAETVTQLPPHGISDAVYERVRAEFSDKELSDLTLVVVAINGWNRMSIAFQSVPGSMDAAYGLTKAGLSVAA